MEKIHIDFIEDDFKGNPVHYTDCAVGRGLKRMGYKKLRPGEGVFDYEIDGIEYKVSKPVINGIIQTSRYQSFHYFAILGYINRNEKWSASLTLEAI